jgi:predicted small lipoprotein YifL
MKSAAATRIVIAALGLLLTCAGCGFKGPLYLPEKNATVVTHPAAKNKNKTAQPPNSAPTPPPSPPPPSAQ